MNTALTAAGAITVPPRGHESIIERMSRWTRALPARSHAGEQNHSREYLAELHERRVEAERLHNERFSKVAIGRMV